MNHLGRTGGEIWGGENKGLEGRTRTGKQETRVFPGKRDLEAQRGAEGSSSLSLLYPGTRRRQQSPGNGGHLGRVQGSPVF